jgi:hypothetical protein
MGDINRLIHDRAVFDANTTAGAQIHVDAPGPFPDFHFEVPGGPLDRLKIRIGDELDI